jgi:hypothetical protein
MAGTKHPVAVGEQLPVQLLGHREPSLARRQSGEVGARGEGVRMVVTKDPAPVGQHVAGHLLGIGEPTLPADHPGHILTGGEGVGVA